MAVYIHQLKGWPDFTWDKDSIAGLLPGLHRRLGKLQGAMGHYGFTLQQKTSFESLSSEVLKSSEIEGEILNPDQVRSSLARKLGMEFAGMVPSDRHVDGLVEMMIDATQNFREKLSAERLFNWHSAMFPGGYSGMHKILTGTWRNNTKDDPMQVVSGPLNRQTVHYQAPDSELIEKEMNHFFQWFNGKTEPDPIIKAAISHLWFVTIHPFDDGNGRIARAITDMQLSRADGSKHRFYSMSAQIRTERKKYYDVLEETQKGNLDISAWIEWFLHCLNRALDSTEETIGRVVFKARFWEKHATTILNQRQVLMLNKLLDGFEGKLHSGKWAKITKTSADTAIRDINDLVLKGILLKDAAGGRSTSYHMAS